MTDLKKFLDQAGVSTLWSAVAVEVKKVDDKVAVNTSDISTMKSQIAALEAGTYDDTAVRELITANTKSIGDNSTNIAANTAAITRLNGDENTDGSVKYTAAQAAATKVAEVVAGADASFDTLKEIADWILSDTTGAAGMANDITALKAKLDGVEETVVLAIAAALEEALKAEGVDKYALATDLTALTTRVKAVEDANYQNAEQVGSAIDAKITALNLATTYEAKGAATTALNQAKAYADGLATNYDAAGAADAVYEKIQALTEAEIKAAIAVAE